MGISSASYNEYIYFAFTLFHKKKMFFYSVLFFWLSGFLKGNVLVWLEGDGGKSTAISYLLVQKSFSVCGI